MSRLEDISHNNRRYRLRDLLILIALVGFALAIAYASVHTALFTSLVP